MLMMPIMVWASEEALKPRLVVCTDIAPADVEPDDMESMVRLMAYADLFEIEALITSVGWNCDPYPVEWAQYLQRVIEAYRKDVPKLPPHLDIPRLAAIHAATPVALVLHGSSGIPHDQVREAIANGIVKVNLATEIKDNFMRALKNVLSESDEIDLRKVFPKAMGPVVELLKEKYSVTGAVCC